MLIILNNNEKSTTNILSGVFFIMFIILFFLRLTEISMVGIEDITISLASFGVFLAFMFTQRKNYTNKLIIVIFIISGILGSVALNILLSDLSPNAVLYIGMGTSLIGAISIIVLIIVSIIQLIRFYKK